MGAPMDEEDEPLALIVASLGEAAKTSAAAHTAADAAHQAALETQRPLPCSRSNPATGRPAWSRRSTL